MSTSLLAVSVVATALLVHAAAAAEAPVHPGRATYLRYCGACHGPTARGDGIAGTFMSPKPTDLTQTAKRSGGTFQATKVLRYIDGTEDVRAHGDPDMPVWGEIFREEPGWDQTRRAEVRGKLLMIVDYIQSVQVK